MLERAHRHEQYYAEIAICVDFLNKYEHQRSAKLKNMFYAQKDGIEMYGNVLHRNILFSECYRFSSANCNFWAERTGRLLSFLIVAGQFSYFQETVQQLHKALNAFPEDTRKSIEEELSEGSRDSIEQKLVESIVLPKAFLPRARTGLTPSEVLDCLAHLLLVFDTYCFSSLRTNLKHLVTSLLSYLRRDQDVRAKLILDTFKNPSQTWTILHVLAQCPDRLPDLKFVLTLHPKLAELETFPSGTALEVACAQGNSELVKAFLAANPNLNSVVWSRVLVKAIAGDVPIPGPHPNNVQISTAEIGVRMEIAKAVLGHYLRVESNASPGYLTISEPGCHNHRYRYAIIAAAAFYPAEFITWLLDKGLDPHSSFQYTVSVKNWKIYEKVYFPNALREALMFNSDEAVSVIHTAMKQPLTGNSLEECVFLAARRGLWNLVTLLMQDQVCSNVYVLKEAVLDLARDNRGDLLHLFLKPGKCLDVSSAVSRAILNRNIDFLLHLVKFYRYTIINSSGFSSVTFSPDLLSLVQLCYQLLMPKTLHERATPLHVLSRIGISSLVSAVLSNSAGLLLNELKTEEPIAIAAASGFSKVVDVYLDHLAAAQCDVTQYVRKALAAAILGKWGSQYNIKVPHYIPQAVFTSQVPLRYHKHFNNNAQYQNEFKSWAKTYDAPWSTGLPGINNVELRHFRDSADAIVEYQTQLEKIRTYNEEVQKQQTQSEHFFLNQTKRMNVMRGIPAAKMPCSTYQDPHAFFQSSAFSEEEEAVFPSLQQNLDETIMSLASQLSPQALSASVDVLSIAAFYGERLVLERLSISTLSTSVLLRLLTQMLNGFIYIFSPLFCSFYQSTWARHTFTIPCSYPSPEARMEHKRWWLHMMERLADAAGTSTLQEGDNPAEMRMGFLHVFYSCLHYLLLRVIVPLYPLAERLNIDRSVYSVILLTAARYSDNASIHDLVNMGANPNWSHCIPSWVTVPRYDTRDETFERESESLGPWSDSESSLLSAGVQHPDENSSRQLPTALHWACENEDVELAQFLLGNKALKSQQVPLSLLKPQPQQRVFKTLQVTPLDVACLRGNWSLIQVLKGDDELTPKHFSLIVKSGNVQAFKSAAESIGNALGIIREKHFLLKAVKHGKRALAHEILLIYLQSGLTDEIAIIKSKRDSILHYCALNGMTEFAAELRRHLSDASWSQLCGTMNSYDCTPYLLARLISRKDASLMFDDALNEWSAGLVWKSAFCSDMFESQVECPMVRYYLDSNEILRSSALFSQLYSSLACANTRMTQKLLTNAPLLSKAIGFFEEHIKKQSGLISRLLYERGIKTGDMESVRLLRTALLPLTPDLVLYSCKYGRDAFGLFILGELSLSCEAEGMLGVAQEACRTGCVRVLSRLMSEVPQLFVTKMIHSPVEIALVSGRPELFIMIVQHCLATGLLQTDQLLSILKVKEDSPLLHLKCVSELLRQKVMLELGVTGLLGDNPWANIMDAYREDPSSRMICRDKLLLHIAGAAGLHKAVGTLREYLSASVQPALPRAKQDALVEALKITRDESNPELVCKASGVTIYLKPGVLENLPAEGWEHYFALVNLFSSSGIWGVYEALKQSNSEFSVEVIIEENATLSISYPESTRALIRTSPVSQDSTSDHPLFGSVHTCFIPILKPEFPLQQTQDLQTKVVAYITGLTAASKRLGIEGLEVVFDYESVALEQLPIVVQEFSSAKTDWMSCPACGLTGLLFKFRDLMKEESEYYGKFAYEMGTDHDEEAGQGTGQPTFYRSSSTRLRLSSSIDVGEDLNRHFERMVVDGLRITMKCTSSSTMDSVLDSEDWLFCLQDSCALGYCYKFRPYAELKLKTVSHRLLSLFQFETEQFKRNVEFNIPSLIDGLGIPVAKAAIQLGLQSPLISPIHVVQLFLASFRTQKWTHTMVRICMQHFYIIEESRAILIELEPHFISSPYETGQLIDRIARIESITYHFRGKILCMTLHVNIGDLSALAQLDDSGGKIDFTNFPVYSQQKVVFLEQLLSKDLIIEEELKKSSIQHMLDLHNQTLSEELGLEMQVSLNWQSLVEELKTRLKLICADGGDLYEKGWEFQHLGELSMRLESKDFWMQLAHQYSTMDWDDLISLKMNCGQYPTFTLGRGFHPRESSYGRLAIDGFHDPLLKRSYLLQIDPQNIDMLTTTDHCRLLIFTKEEKFVCELLQYESDLLRVTRGKRTQEIALKTITRCYVVSGKYPAEEHLKYAKSQVLVSDSVGRVWKVRAVVLPSYIKKEGLYSEELSIPTWGEMTRPFPTQPSLNFSQEEDGIKGFLTASLSPVVQRLPLRANPKCYLFLDTTLEEAKSALNRRFTKIRKFAHMRNWEIELRYRLSEDCMIPLDQIFGTYAATARERLLFVFYNFLDALESIVLCRNSVKTFHQPLFSMDLPMPASLLAHQVAVLLEQHLRQVTILLSFEEGRSVLELKNGVLTIRLLFQSIDLVDQLSTENLTQFLLSEILKAELNLPIKSSKTVHSEIKSEKSVLGLEEFMLLSVFPLLFTSCEHAAQVCALSEITLRLVFNEVSESRAWGITLEGGKSVLSVFSGSKTKTVVPTFSGLLKELYKSLHAEEQVVSKVSFMPRDQQSVLLTRGQIALEAQGEAVDPSFISCLLVDWNAPEIAVPAEVRVEDSVLTLKVPETEKKLRLLVFYKGMLKYISSVEVNGTSFIDIYNCHPKYAIFTSIQFLVDLSCSRRVRFTVPTHFIPSSKTFVQTYRFDLITIYAFIFQEPKSKQKNVLHKVKCQQVTERFAVVQFQSATMENKYLCAVSNRTGYLLKVFKSSFQAVPVTYSELELMLTCRLKPKPDHKSLTQLFALEPPKSVTRYSVFSEGLLFEFKEGRPDSRCAQVVTEGLEIGEEVLTSTAGLLRRDWVEARDRLGNRIVDGEWKFTAEFRHGKEVARYVADVRNRENGVYELAWTPLKKGAYFLYIDGVKVSNKAKFFIRNAKISPEFCTILADKSCFIGEKNVMYVRLRDAFENVFSLDDSATRSSEKYYGELQINEEFKLTASFLSPEEESPCNLYKVDPRGLVKVEGIVEFKEWLKLKVEINGQPVKNSPVTLRLQPMRYQTKLKKFMKACKALPGYRAEQNVSVSRTEFLEELLTTFAHNEPRGTLWVKWKNEPGYDAGGLRREFFDKLSREIVKPESHVFKQHGAYVKPDPTASQHHTDVNTLFSVVGMLCARAAIHKILLDISFAPSIYKSILGKQLIPEDLKDDDPELWTSLEAIKTMDPEVLAASELYFTVTHDDLSVVELIPEGATQQVTVDNRAEYISTRALWHLVGSVQPMLEAFCAGFHEAVPQRILSIFESSELPKVVNGSTEFSVSFLKKRTRYELCTAQTREIRWLWSWLETASESIIKGFLRFTTGSARIPFHDRHWYLTVNRTFGSDVLPRASTCSNTIYIPLYGTYKQMVKFMTIAVQEGSEGFGDT